MCWNRLFVAVAVLGLAGLAAGAQAAEMVDNPTYQNWAKYKPGTFATLKSTDIPSPTTAEPAPKVSTTIITLKLVSIDADKAVVEMTQSLSTNGAERTMPSRKSEIRAKVEKLRNDAQAASGKDDKEEVSDAKTGTDTVEFKGQKLATTTQEQTTKMVGSGLTIHTKTWTSGEVPCGVVKMEITREGPIAGTSRTELVDFAVVK